MPSLPQLIAVFEDARRWVARPENDFMWSSWIDTEAALFEIDGILNLLRSGEVPSGMDILFAPTGPMQELAMSSGWGDEFIDLANRYDAAMAVREPPPRPFLAALEACDCFDDPCAPREETQNLGMDANYAEVTLLSCPTCGQVWLRYFYENEAFSRSGRWYLAPLPDTPFDAQNAREVLGSQEWYFYGGSYYDGQTGKAHGPILLNP